MHNKLADLITIQKSVRCAGGAALQCNLTVLYLNLDFALVLELHHVLLLSKFIFNTSQKVGSS